MKLTKEQTLSFIKDDKTIADTSGIKYEESSIEQVSSDEAIFTLIVKIQDKFYRGVVKYFDDGGSFVEGDLTYRPGFFSDFNGLELKEVKKVSKIIEVWEDV